MRKIVCGLISVVIDSPNDSIGPWFGPETAKYVVSGTLKSADWQRSTVIRRDRTAAEIALLKDQPRSEHRADWQRDCRQLAPPRGAAGRTAPAGVSCRAWLRKTPVRRARRQAATAHAHRLCDFPHRSRTSSPRSKADNGGAPSGGTLRSGALADASRETPDQGTARGGSARGAGVSSEASTRGELAICELQQGKEVAAGHVYNGDVPPFHDLSGVAGLVLCGLACGSAIVCGWAWRAGALRGLGR